MHPNIPIALDTEAAARCVGLSVSTLNKLRLSGDGPVFCKLGRRVVYRLDELDAWMKEHQRSSTSDRGCDNGDS